MVVAALLVNTVRWLVISVALLCVVACVSSSGGRHAETAPVPIPSAGVTDASYDWHGLLVVPLGTLLKESPVPLHEVLLFHDETRPADVENKDCFAIDGVPPRFVGQPPDEFLLCFDHDHLNRLEASVRLPATEAAEIFARACALWLKGSLPAAPTAPVGNVCDGRDGDIAFAARLGPARSDAATNLSMTLLHAALRETVHDADH